MEVGTSSSGLVKAKSETLSEALKSSSLDFSSNGGGSSHGRKHHVRASSSPSKSGSSNKQSNRRNTHIKKAKSAHPALDLSRLTGGAALSRASSASLGLSFSFTGFAVPHEEDIIPSDHAAMMITWKILKQQLVLWSSFRKNQPLQYI
ncbi:ABC-2 type transporter family protein [Raphanus sativus]|nr:ABC-2 type transporter family protein [Raphanus sativus]